jgi:hypothetical protein
MSGNHLWNPAKKLDKAGVTYDKTIGQTCLGWGPDISGLGLWNPAKKSDKVRVTRDKAERSDMSKMRARHV